MIPFNIFGHSNTTGEDNEPIVWVDSSDNSSYTLSGNDVTALFNKGSLGGAMTLNGNVKFANSGFESWSASDYITRDLGEPFMTDNSFTIALTYDLQNLTSGNVNTANYFMLVRDNTSRNIIYSGRISTVERNYIEASGVVNQNQTEGYSLGVGTVVISYNHNTGNFSLIKHRGSELENWFNGSFNNVGNTIISLLSLTTLAPTFNSGADNPLHEFRLYDRAFSLTEMQNLQTELNVKHSKPIVWVDSSDNTTYTLSGNDVLTLNNKGSLGGAMTLNGSVKFANSGFESWSNSDYITRDLGEPFMTNNSFTMVCTFDLQDASSGTGFVSRLLSDANNFLNTAYASNQLYIEKRSSGAYNGKADAITSLVQTTVFSYDVTSQLLLMINYTEFGLTLNSVVFNNTLNSIISLLSDFGVNNTGADNPLHEFRLYDRAFSLTEMQDLQTELNDKYTP